MLRHFIFLLVLLPWSALAEQQVQPKIPPGYVSSASADEQGLWSELVDYEQALMRSALRVKDKNLNAYVQNTMCRVAGEYCQDLRVYVLRNPNFNASITANGVVSVWTGLLLRVSSEDELASILGHELAHYTQLHSLEQLRRASAAMTAGSIVDLGLTMLAGAEVNLGQMAATAGIMSFSRGDETEADLLGARFIADAGYNPRAAARVWEMLVAENEQAAVKEQKAGIFSKTHPSSHDRVKALKSYVAAEFPDAPPVDTEGRAQHVAMLNRHYQFMMEDQLDTNRHGRTGAMLERHREVGVNDSLIHFFYGEMYRQRDEEGDRQLALDSYGRAAKAENPVPEAFQQLGYLHMKQGEKDQAKINFETYLLLAPGSDDRAMIEFYLEDL